MPLLAALLFTVNSSVAQTPRRGGDSAGVTGPPKRAHATRLERGSIDIDGRLDDAAWRSAQWISDFVQREPTEGAAPAERTEVALLYDRDALYVAARMVHASPEPIRALVTRRDREGSSEQFVVSLDSYLDRRTAYSFGVTAAGVRIDYYHPTDFQSQRDYSFDPVWEAKTKVTPSEWTAELRIPFTQLRFNDRATQLWGVNLSRTIPARNEENYWVLVRRNETGWASRFGELEGIEGIEPSHRVELSPYVASDAKLLGQVDRNNPFLEKRELAARIGTDLKVGLGPSLTLDATINPDFGQVEADPAEVNLSAFETVFPERRPFFVEGSQLLRANSLPFFLSRRIGQAPRRRPPGDYVEAIANTTILGAAKVTGRLPSGLSIGALTAITAREEARTFDARTKGFRDEEVEPLTGYGVVRLQQELGQSGSTVGVIATGVERRADSGAPIADVLARRAYSGAVDWNLRFKRGAYNLAGSLGASYVAGDSAAILRVQQASAHFYQRPDATPVRLDPSRTWIAGHFVSANLNKNTGRWLWGVNAYGESPGLEINDAGRIGSSDDRGFGGSLRYRQTTPGRRLRYWDVRAETFHEWNYDGIRGTSFYGTGANATWTNFWSLGGGANVVVRSLSDNLTRGGPLMGNAGAREVYAYGSSNPANKMRWSGDVGYFRDDFDGWNFRVATGLSIRPGTQWELSADPRYSRGVTSRQFFTSLAGGSAATFGRRYVFAYTERSELSTRLRLNYALTPDLTLETYTEPFAASGRFYRIGELPAARSFALREYGTSATTITRYGTDSLVVTDGAARFVLPYRDFNVLSFRSNVVLRWEWRPGSTAFLVWQQNRGSQEPIDRLVRPASLWDALSANGDNFVAVKVSYWISVK